MSRKKKPSRPNKAGVFEVRDGKTVQIAGPGIKTPPSKAETSKDTKPKTDRSKSEADEKAGSAKSKAKA